MSGKKLGGSALAVLSLMGILSGCSPLIMQEDSASKDRIAYLEGELADTRDRLSKEETLRLETQKHQARILSCHRDFRGSYGKLIRKEIELVRKTARIVRRDCSGAVVSDRKETISPPRDFLELPELAFLQKTKAEVIVLNRQTCGGGGFRSGFWPVSSPSLWVDRANAVLTHEVFSGLNIIDFGLCDKNGLSEGVSSDCSKPTWVASLELQVRDPEIQENDIHEATESNCPSK